MIKDTKFYKIIKRGFKIIKNIATSILFLAVSPIIIVFTFSMLVSIGIICNITVDKELIMELIDEALSNYIDDSEDK